MHKTPGAAWGPWEPLGDPGSPWLRREPAGEEGIRATGAEDPRREERAEQAEHSRQTAVMMVERREQEGGGMRLEMSPRTRSYIEEVLLT